MNHNIGHSNIQPGFFTLFCYTTDSVHFYSTDLLTFEIKVAVKIFDPTLKRIDFKKKSDANSFKCRSEARSATVTVRVSNLRDFLAMFSPVDR